MRISDWSSDVCSSHLAPLTTVVADRFAPSERGTASGFVGAGMASGLTVGTIVAGLLAGTITFAYWLFGGAIIVVCLAFVAINREPKVEATLPPPFRASEFLKIGRAHV